MSLNMLGARMYPPWAVFTAGVVCLDSVLKTTAVRATMVRRVHPVTRALTAASCAGLQSLVIDVALNVSRVSLRILLLTFLFH